MKDHVDKSRGIAILIDEVLDKIKPTEPLRLVKHAARRKRKGQIPPVSSPVKVLSSRSP